MNFINGFMVFFMFFFYAASAPAGQHDDCSKVRDSALQFNQISKVAFVSRHQRGIKNFTTSLAWMDAQDHCDPRTLRLNPESCVKKMLDVLTSYESFVKTVAEYDCPDARKVMPVLKELLKNMKECVRTEYHPLNVVALIEEPIQSWQKPLVCSYTMERLFSFSILTARVFSVGDPANHAEPTGRDSPNCAQKNV